MIILISKTGEVTKVSSMTDSVHKHIKDTGCTVLSCYTSQRNTVNNPMQWDARREKWDDINAYITPPFIMPDKYRSLTTHCTFRNCDGQVQVHLYNTAVGVWTDFNEMSWDSIKNSALFEKTK